MYATAEQFIERIGELQSIELTDRDNQGEIDRSLLDIALSDSSSQIDGYLAARYHLPLAQIPQNLTRLCCDLTRYRLCSMSGVDTTDEIIERYKLSLKELEQLSSGKISLGINENSQDALNGDGSVQFFNHSNRIFSRDKQN